MDNDTYEPPKKKLKKNRKPKENVTVETSLSTNNADEFNNESSESPKKKLKKIKKVKDDVAFETSLNASNPDEFNEESVIYIKKHKKHKKDKDLSLENIEDSCPVKKKKKRKKSEKLDLQENSDFVEPLVETCMESSNITSNQYNYENNRLESNINETQLNFYENKTKRVLSKFSERKLEEKRTFYPDIKETVNLPSKGRKYTVSIAVPASILKETCLSPMLRTYIIGQLARAACIYSVDEIIVYNDQKWTNNNEINNFIGMMKMILEYQECPQYLRKDLFPIHRFLQYSGVLNALNAPHHLLAYQWCEYREGVVRSRISGKCSYADIGLKSEILIDKKLEPGLRVTVKLPPEAQTMNKMYGYVVSPDEPRIKNGMYWGYTVRVASCLSEVFKSDRFNSGYDLIIGTSDKGNDVNSVSFKEFSHALILFGGVQGLETAKEADESLSKSDMWSLCNHYINVCPNQSSRTIRTEEAVLITLATLCPRLTIKGCTKIK